MRAICTSASLQASTWVSPGFTLFRHSSPPFGSKQAHSNSTSVKAGRCWAILRVHTIYEPCGSPFQYERSTGNDIFSLARLFDSLVRVSRRVKAPHSQLSRQHWAVVKEAGSLQYRFLRCTAVLHNFNYARFTRTSVQQFILPSPPKGKSKVQALDG